MKLYLVKNQQLLAEDVIEARSFFARGRGLLGRRSLSNKATMWIDPCNNIHTWFMQFPIDVVFVDKNLCVQAILREVKPFRIVWPIWRARSVFEFSGGALNSFDIQIGDQLNVGT